jgi:hypothetical protein
VFALRLLPVVDGLEVGVELLDGRAVLHEVSACSGDRFLNDVNCCQLGHKKSSKFWAVRHSSLNRGVEGGDYVMTIRKIQVEI